MSVAHRAAKNHPWRKRVSPAERFYKATLPLSYALDVNDFAQGKTNKIGNIPKSGVTNG